MSDKAEWRFMSEFWHEVTFLYRTSSRASEEGGDDEDVYLVGDFNCWNARSNKMEPCSEGYSTTLLLSEGFYHYKFVIGGSRWLRDPSNPHIGGRFDNSIMFVHMDPKVYSLREQHPPHRDYHRPFSDGGEFRVHCPELPEDIASSGILQRLIFVYLPPSYNSDSERRYPVLYANDGQNIFSTPEDKGGPCRGGWYLDAKLDHYWDRKLLPEFILVGVPNSDFICIGNRNREYCTAKFGDTSGDPYSRYLIEVVKEEIDGAYRTLPSRENTIVLGASMGGLSAFVLALGHSDVFSSCISMSPSFWYVDKENSTAYDLVRTLLTQGRPLPDRVYIDSGDGVGDNCYETKLMRDIMVESKWGDSNFMYVLDECAGKVAMEITHSESVWRERILQALQFALGVVG